MNGTHRVAQVVCSLQTLDNRANAERMIAELHLRSADQTEANEEMMETAKRGDAEHLAVLFEKGAWCNFRDTVSSIV